LLVQKAEGHFYLLLFLLMAIGCLLMMCVASVQWMSWVVSSHSLRLLLLLLLLASEGQMGNSRSLHHNRVMPGSLNLLARIFLWLLPCRCG
jgi:hypothetical protein